MTNQLDRRVRKLEASAKGGDGDLAVRVAFIHAGQDRHEQISRQLGELRPRDIIVRFVSPGDVPRRDEVLQ